MELTCDWNEAQLADNLRDKFVMGLYNERLLQQLLTHDHKKLLEDLFQHALTFKATEQESLKRAETADNTTTVNALNQPPRKNRSAPKLQLIVIQINILLRGKYRMLNNSINALENALAVEQITPVVLAFVMQNVTSVEK